MKEEVYFLIVLLKICFPFYTFAGENNQVEKTTRYSIDSYDDGRF